MEAASQLEAEICQRFVRLSCEKMIASRNSRGGARLHRNLLILHLLRKARQSTKMMPYECSDLLKRNPSSSLLPVAQRIISTSAVINKNNGVNERIPLCIEGSEGSAITATFIVFDTNEDGGGCEKPADEIENPDENAGLFPLRRHVNRQQLFEGDVELSEDENLTVARKDDNNEMDDIFEDLSHPMDDVNMKIDSHIESQFPSEDEVRGAVEQTCQKPLSSIGNHLGRQSTLFGGSSLMEISKCHRVKSKENDDEDVYQSIEFPSNERKSWSSKSNYHTSSSFIHSYSNSTNSTIRYQYENKEEPLEYKVHDREDEQHVQRQHYREGHADYSQLEFSNDSSSYTSGHHSVEERRYFKSVEEQEEFERQQCRHFSGRLYERCNFTHFNQSQTHSGIKFGGSLRINHSLFNSSSSHSNQSENKIEQHTVDRKLSSSFSRIHKSSAWRTITKRDEDHTEAIEEGTDIAAQMETDPPQPLRSSSDWLRRQFNHIGQSVFGLSAGNQEPNLSLILATPLSPPFMKPSEAQQIPFPKHFNGFENERENLKDDDVDDGKEDDLREESPPKTFYADYCSPPGSPPEEKGVLVFEFQDEDESYGQTKDSEQLLKSDGRLQEDEEGFFDDEEDDECDEDCEENHKHSSKRRKTMRKRKTTGTGAGRLAVLEKRPCCNEESGENESQDSNHTEEDVPKKDDADSDSGVDVNGALGDIFCEDPSSSGFKTVVKTMPSKNAIEKPADQTVPVATLYL